MSIKILEMSIQFKKKCNYTNYSQICLLSVSHRSKAYILIKKQDINI